MAEESELACYPWAVSTWLLAGWGFATAGMSWAFPGANPLSQWLHSLVGLALAAYALWGVWRPRIAVVGGRLVEHPGAGRRMRSTPLESIAGVVGSPRTGHRPSESDLDRLLGLRLQGGGFQWVDLRWLLAADRRRLRERVEPAGTPR